jgi:GntR family transcriptional repressor for pyruvate dehydrogenase complex
VTVRPPLASGLADTIVNDIIAGRYLTNAPLPSETDLATESGLSRLTVREAVKSLAAKGVVRVEQGRGTFVNPSDSWSVLDPVLLLARSNRDGDRLALPRMLIEARRTEADLADMEHALRGMRSAAAVADVAAFVAADIAFHQYVLDAARNSFITSLFDPLSRILQLTRHQTSAHEPVREHAIGHHQQILDAVRAGDPAQAGRVMREHMTQTEQDMDTYVLDPGAAMLALRAGDSEVTPRRRARG